MNEFVAQSHKTPLSDTLRSGATAFLHDSGCV
jgi:hypothetical protein